MDIENLYKAQEIFLFKACYALEKIHGCLEANTVVLTEEGEKTIQEICDSKYNGRVLSFDLTSGKQLFKKVISHSIGEDCEEWFEIALDDGRKIIATSNHRFWIEDMKCWREIGNLKIGDELKVT